MSDGPGVERQADRLGGLDPSGLLRLGLEAEETFGGNAEAHSSPGSAFIPPEPHELTEHFPELEVLERIGRGGMGCVYKARQTRLDRFVALKILPPELGQDPAFAERFAREARAMARLVHPNIVTLHDFGEAGGMYYFVMEYMDGMNLRELMEAGRIDPAETLKIVPQMCSALEYAHDLGIVHRDVKPENILFDRRGHVKIADFGLVKLAAAARTPQDISLTQTRHAMGTPHYMAPEQWETPRQVDHRADIYGLGVVFYEMLTGRLPWGRFDPPSLVVPVNPKLDEVVLKALQRDPEKRYASAGEMQREIERAARSAAGGPSPELRIGNYTLPPVVQSARPLARSAGLYVRRKFEGFPYGTLVAAVFILICSTVSWVIGSEEREERDRRSSDGITAVAGPATLAPIAAGRAQDADARPGYRRTKYERGFNAFETSVICNRLRIGNYWPFVASLVIFFLALLSSRLGLRADLLIAVLSFYGIIHIGMLVGAGPGNIKVDSHYGSEYGFEGLTVAPFVVCAVFAVLFLGSLWSMAGRIYRAMDSERGVRGVFRSVYRVMFTDSTRL